MCILYFSDTYSTQSADFTRVNNSVKVTCVFAINAPASACQIVFTNASLGLNFSGIVNHSLPESTGLIDIPKTILQAEAMQHLGSVVFDVTVYDVNMDGSVTNDTAYEQGNGLVIEALLQPSPCPSSSSDFGMGLVHFTAMSSDMLTITLVTEFCVH